MVMLRRLWIQITSDRKRFGLLCAMLALGLLLWGRIIVTSNVPRTAMAGEAGPGRGTTPLGPATGASDKPLGPPVRVKLARQPRRDPFLVSAKHFPKPTPVELLTQDDPKSGGNATENTNRTDERLTEELRARVNRFRLEAVMQGRLAVINGKTYRLYSWIQAVGNDAIRFRLLEVGQRSVVLEYEGRRFRLRMDFPGSEER